MKWNKGMGNIFLQKKKFILNKFLTNSLTIKSRIKFKYHNEENYDIG